MPEATFKKQISLDQADGKTIVLEVGATDQALLDQIEARHFTVDLNVPEMNDGEESHGCTQAHSDEESHEDAKAKPVEPLPSRFITVQVLGAYAEKEIHSYAIHFSDAMQDLMRREKLGMNVILSGSEYEPAAKTNGHWYPTRACARMRLNGDGGQIKTRVQTYRAYLSGNTWVRGSALHTPYLEFLNYVYCTKCAHGVSRIKDVWVIQDVLSTVWVLDAC